jgi:hypothetical protein
MNDASNNQLIATLAQLLGVATPMSITPAGLNTTRPGNTMHTSVTQPAGLVEQIRAMVGPSLAAHVLGMRNPTTLMSVAPGQGVGEAYYAHASTTRAWQMVQNEAAFNMARGFGQDFARTTERLHIPQMLGMDLKKYRDIVNKGASTAAGAMLASQMMSLPGMDALMGGNPLDAYQRVFAKRSSFDDQWGFMAHPFDKGRQEHTRQISTDLTNALEMAIRGGTPGSGFGLSQNFGFTRGMRDEDIASVMVRMSEGGAFGDTGLRMRIAQDADLQEAIKNGIRQEDAVAVRGPRYMQEQERIVKQVGAANRLFETLGDIMGSRDMAQLMQTMDELTGSQWESMDEQTIGKLNANLRDMQATAQVLNVSNTEMLGAVQAMQRTMQGATGVTANQIAMGMTGGGFGDAAAAINMTQHAYAVAQANGVRSAAGINRVSTQQAGLMAIGLDSSAGKSARLVEYLNQQGMIDPELYQQAVGAISTGTQGQRNNMINAVLERAFGSVAEGRKMIDDPYFMQTMREKTGSEAAQRVMATIRNGQATEWGQRVLTQQWRGLGGYVTGMQKQAGMSHAVDPQAVARESYEITKDFLNLQSLEDVPASARVLAKKSYEDAINSGKTPQQAYAAMRSYISRDPGLSRYATDIANEVSRSTTALGVTNMMNQLTSGKQLVTTFSQLRNWDFESRLTDSQKKELGEIRKLGRTDPNAAAPQLDEFLARHDIAKKFDYFEKKQITEQRDKVKRDTEEVVALAGAKHAAVARITAGLGAGMNISDIQTANTRYGQALDAYIKDIDDGNTQQGKARFEFTLSNVAGILDPAELQTAAQLAANGDPAQLAAARKRQSIIEAHDMISMAAASKDRNLQIDLMRGVGDEHRAQMAPERLRAQTYSLGLWNQRMADTPELQNLRKTLSQVAVDFASGKAGLATLFGVSEGAPLVKDEALNKELDKYRKQMRLDEFEKGLEAAQKKTGAAIAEFDALQLADLKNVEVTERMQRDFDKAVKQGNLKTHEDFDQFLARGAYTGVSNDAKDALRKVWQGSSEEDKLQGDYAKRMSGVVETKEFEGFKKRLTAARTREARKADREIQDVMTNATDDGLAGLYDIKKGELSSDQLQVLTKALSAFAPKDGNYKKRDLTDMAVQVFTDPVTGKSMTRDEVAAKYRSGTLSKEQFEAYGLINDVLESVDRKRRDTREASVDKMAGREPGKGVGGRGDRIKGTLQLIDKKGQPLGNVNIDAEYE